MNEVVIFGVCCVYIERLFTPMNTASPESMDKLVSGIKKCCDLAYMVPIPKMNCTMEID